MEAASNKKKITIDEIAALSGVSKTTVSRVLSGRADLVKKETREKVIQTIKEKNYRPSIIARSLRTKKTKAIGLILADIENPFYARVAKGVIDTAEDLNYTVIISNSNYDMKTEEKLLDTLISRQVEGLLFTTINLREKIVKILKTMRVPFMLVDGKSDYGDINYITNDNYYGGKLAAEYLISMGHTAIGFVGSDKIYSLKERHRGFKDTLARNGLPDTIRVKIKDVLDSQELKSKTRQLICDNQISAFFAGNDHIAIEVLNFVTNELGLNIPEDLSIIGYDNIKVASAVRVPLTTIKQSKYSMGKIAVEQLVEILKSEDYNCIRRIILKPKLVIRESVKAIG
ncbi:MAG: LacI family DNA-binding transcriptional regulator [Actinomycetota bacterium]|nr:LacI family DNA-binding transcriptional regulator [Actinomycetota bacterium]